MTNKARLRFRFQATKDPAGGWAVVDRERADTMLIVDSFPTRGEARLAAKQRNMAQWFVVG
jgi:hypothetical protein